MPEPRNDETRDEWMERCVPKVLEDGTADDREQAVAICSSMWDDKQGGDRMIEYGKPLQVTETKAREDHWEVAGYLSTYGNEDLGGDVVVEGAFDRWLDSGRKTRFFYQHRPDKVLGVWQELKGDSTGLFGRAKISKTVLGEEVYTLVQDGAVDSFSIGYITKDADKKDGVRYLKDLDLPEGSLVSIPMNPEAAVTAWKDWLDAFGLDGDDMTLAEKASYLAEGLDELLRDTRGLVDSIDKPLSNTKRRQFADLLETFSSLGAVRSDLKTVLAAAPRKTNVDAARVLHGLHRRRRELAHLLEE